MTVKKSLPLTYCKSNNIVITTKPSDGDLVLHVPRPPLRFGVDCVDDEEVGGEVILG